MFWAQVVLPLIIGLVVISWQNAQAQESSSLKGTNSTRPGNKTTFEVPPLAENFLYTYFVCRDKPDGLRLPVAGSCVDYYECQKGAARRLTCKTGTQFSNSGLTCLDSRLSKCKPEQQNVKCEGLCCGRADGLYPAKGSCSDFLICVNGQTFPTSCGKLLHFSPENLVCDIPDRARCTAVIDKDIIEEPIEKGQENQVNQSKPVMYMVTHRACRNHPNGYYAPIFGSCNKFYLCINGIGYLKSCGHLQFNPETHYCDARTRMFCPETEDDEVILDGIEYAEVSPLPMPIQRPKPQGPQIRPIPLELDEDEKEVKQNWPQWGKRPAHFEEEEEEVGPPLPPHSRPQNDRRPTPPQEEEEEDVEKESLPLWGKKPSYIPQIPQEKENESQATADRPEKPKKKKPVQEPLREQSGNKNQSPKQPISDPKPPHMELSTEEQEEEENNVASANSKICTDQPVGALMAMPGDCTKYIRCRWDWYERRAAEVMTCPPKMHFNAKSKYCDWPENAGCVAGAKKPSEFNHRKNKFTKIF